MARAKNEKAEIALKLYKQGHSQKDIAEQLGVPDGTVRRWKSTYKWGEPNVKKKANEQKKANNINRSAKNKIVQNIEDDIASVMANDDLSEEQKHFCLFYVRSFNATKSYMKAYKCSYDAASASGSRLLANAKIRDEINRLKQNRYQRELINEADIFQKYLDIAFSDITDFVEFDYDGETNKINVKNSSHVDGTLIDRISTDRNGNIDIKLLDKAKALDWLADHMDLATEEQKARIAVLKTKSAGEIPGEVDTSYVDALKGLAEKVWDDEKEEN